MLQVARGRIQGGAFGGSTGDAGAVVITADTLIVEQEGRIASVLGGTGAGGRLDLKVHDLIVRSGGQIRASVDSDSREPGFASGDAGSITIRASGSVTVTGEDSAIASRTVGTGNAGQIRIQAEQLMVADQGQINTETLTSGHGGNITIEANEVRLANRGGINTSSRSQDDNAGAGGNITVSAQSMLRLHDSEITTSVIGGEKNGGNIDLRANAGLLERSNIRANAFGGPGGNIMIRTQALITDPTSEVPASSALDVDGTVAVEGMIDVSGALKPISQRFAQAEALLQNRCVERLRQQQRFRFLVRGRDRMTIDPDGLLPNPLVPTIETAAAPPQWPGTDDLSLRLSHLAPAMNAWQKDCMH